VFFESPDPARMKRTSKQTIYKNQYDDIGGCWKCV